MIVIGLTGSIGMGKSDTAKIFRILGIPVHDSDACVHELLSSSIMCEKIVQICPRAVDLRTRKIDRKILGEAVFADRSLKKKLEEIIHPLVWQSQRQFLLKAKKAAAKFAVLDIPLLYETQTESKCDIVIVVTAPHFIQRQRVLSRSGMTVEKFQSILSAQYPDSAKKRRADYLVHTGIGRAHVMNQVRDILGQLQKKE